MKLEGKVIEHAKFGKGVVKELGESYITIVFPYGEKKFVYPEAFCKFLVLRDQASQAKVNEILQEVTKKENEKRYKERNRQRLDRQLMGLKIPENNQAAFGLIQNQKEDIFRTWTIYAGEYRKGNYKGQPKPPIRMKLNSACLVTERLTTETERERRIVGVFMVPEDFTGRNCENGIITGHEYYRLQLEESEQLLFWDYFTLCSQQIRWGMSEIKYFSNFTMQSILKEINTQVKEKEKMELAQRMYEYFCYVNKLEK